MSIRHYDSGPTSNDLLESLVAGYNSAALNDPVVAQNAEDVPNVENAPAVNREA
jgi:hypothetical protein